MADDLSLLLLNTLREAMDDRPEVEAVSAPGQSEPGEFYVTARGVDYVVRLEVM